MNALIIYDSAFGNTQEIAGVIAAILGESCAVRLVPADEADISALNKADILIVGGPTQHHGPTPAVNALIERLPRASLQGMKVASFDTRYHLPTLFSGSAATSIAQQLTSKGALLLVPTESFFISSKEGPLEDGEVERAQQWANIVLEQCICR